MARGRDYTPDEPRESATGAPWPARPAEEDSRNGRGGGGASQEQQAYDSDPRALRPERDRDRTYNLRDSEVQTLAEIGTFRTLALEDLARHRYGGNHDQAQREVRNLTRQGLLRVRTTHVKPAVYLALTREGQRFLKQHRPEGMNPNQVFYSRFVKPREVKHDAALYRLYQQAAQRIGREGGQVRRVVLDFELKKSINAKLARIRSLPEADQARRKKEIAREHGLTVVDGKISLPDVRLEYETADRDQTKVDLELATGDYHRQALSAKVRAGFAIFALQEDAAPLRRAMDDPKLMRDIFSL